VLSSQVLPPPRPGQNPGLPFSEFPQLSPPVFSIETFRVRSLDVSGSGFFSPLSLCQLLVFSAGDGEFFFFESAAHCQSPPTVPFRCVWLDLFIFPWRSFLSSSSPDSFQPLLSTFDPPLDPPVSGARLAHLDALRLRCLVSDPRLGDSLSFNSNRD